MTHPTLYRSSGPRWAALAGGAMLVVAAVLPSSLHAQQSGTAAAKSTSAKPKPKLSPADSAACVQVVSYVMLNPEVQQKGMEIKAIAKGQELVALPDSDRTQIAKALTRGNTETLKSMASKSFGEEKGKTFHPLIDFLGGFPDSVRAAVATLYQNGKSMTCS